MTPRRCSSHRGAARPSSSAAASRDRSPILVFFLTTLVGYLLLAAAMIGLGFLLVDVVLPVHAIGHNDEAVNEWLASQPHAVAQRRLVRRLDDRRHPVHPGARHPHGAGRRRAAPLARARVHPRRDRRRGGDLPRHEPDRAPPAPDRAAPRSRPPARESELSLGPRRGLGGRLRRAGLAHLLAGA